MAESTALISSSDDERLKQQENAVRLADWRQWMLNTKELSNAILARRSGEYIDVNGLEREAKLSLEQRPA